MSKKVIAVVPESNVEELKRELPELWSNIDVTVKVVDDWVFEHWSELKNKPEEQLLTEDS